ncbi:MAG TPA: glycine zipper 2TM domain-containing protein [Thiobacillaceae bacterium]|nr:glycine zipper 2TM domain-containing protein [Thiobacillaceae bacterium]
MKFPLALILAGLVGTSPALADPPAHAPAHGYYKDKRHSGYESDRRDYRRYEGKSGVAYRHDYGIASGRCNRDEIGAVIGGVTGAVIGGQVADRGNRAVGMVIGGAIGAVLGHSIGGSIDAGDRACMGHALELGRPGVPVEWRNAGHRYHFTPGGDAREGCRHATLRVDGGRPRDVLACPTGGGEWRFRRS